MAWLAINLKTFIQAFRENWKNTFHSIIWTRTPNSFCTNDYRGWDHGFTNYRRSKVICGIRPVNSFKNDLLSRFQNEIKGQWTREGLEETYFTVNNQINLFAAGVAKCDNSQEFPEAIFKCVIGKAFKEFPRLFLFPNGWSVFNRTTGESKKNMCLTLKNTEMIRKCLFDVFDPKKQQRRNCVVYRKKHLM